MCQVQFYFSRLCKISSSIYNYIKHFNTRLRRLLFANKKIINGQINSILGVKEKNKSQTIIFPTSAIERKTKVEQLDETQTNSRIRTEKSFKYKDKVEESEEMLVFIEDCKTEQELINSKKYTDKGDKSESDYFGVNEKGNETNAIIHI